MNLDVQRIRNEFPFLTERAGDQLIYLDNAASTQKPQEVLQVMEQFYRTGYANIHRGVYRLAYQATEAYAQARTTVAEFLNANSSREIVFVRGTTEAINLVAQSYGTGNLTPGDRVVLPILEHHANFVPWQVLCRRVGSELKVVPLAPSGLFDLDLLLKEIDEQTKLVALSFVSNSLGTVLPVRKIIEKAHSVGARVLVDAAQAVGSIPLDVQELDCDFLAFSGHKLYGPTGIGILYAREEILDQMPPYQYGGDMIKSVRIEETTFREIPHRFESGTPHIVGAIGLAAAIRFVQSIGLKNILSHKQMLLRHAIQEINRMRSVRIISDPQDNAGILALHIENVHPHDLATYFDQQNIAVRAGHHCTQPLMDFLGIPGTTRISFGCYNTLEEINKTLVALERAQTYFA